MWYSIIQIKVNNYYSSTEDILFDLLINTCLENKVESTQQKTIFILLFWVHHVPASWFGYIVIILLW